MQSVWDRLGAVLSTEDASYHPLISPSMSLAPGLFSVVCSITTTTSLQIKARHLSDLRISQSCVSVWTCLPIHSKLLELSHWGAAGLKRMAWPPAANGQRADVTAGMTEVSSCGSTYSRLVAVFRSVQHFFFCTHRQWTHRFCLLAEQRMDKARCSMTFTQVLRKRRHS